jgi:hypothetical protein
VGHGPRLSLILAQESITENKIISILATAIYNQTIDNCYYCV